MKKFLLSATVVITFIAYAISQKVHSGIGLGKLNVLTIGANNNITTTTQSTTSTTTYKDGSYTGNSSDAYYGSVQVKAIISGGKITDVQFLSYPKDRNYSAMINSQATPYLKSEAIKAQSANVDIVSGATLTSQAFVQSLQSALDQAKA
jgi:uncharacterized protein with FMN-binding domain